METGNEGDVLKQEEDRCAPITRARAKWILPATPRRNGASAFYCRRNCNRKHREIELDLD